MNATKRPFGWGSILMLSAPMLIYFLLVLGDTYKELVPWFRPWQPVVVVVATLLVASFLSKRHRLRAKGFIATSPGFSGEVDALIQKMEERLEEVERAARYQREIDPLPQEFGEFAREVIQTAVVIDKKAILDQLASLRERDAWISLHSISQNEAFQEQMGRYQNAMALAIDELKVYSNDLKRRGGLYKLSQKEFLIAVILILSFTIAGAILLWQFRQDRSWPFWTGGIFILIGIIIAALLVDVLQNQERHRS